MIAAGGTGGHIYPALTLADELKRNGHNITFIGSNNRMEKDVIPSFGYDYIGLDVYSTQGSIFTKAKSVISLYKAYKKCLKLLKGYDLAIGFGNYITVPVILAAHKLGIKTVIHEQNSFVGRANRMLDGHADLVIASYPESVKQFKNPNTKVLGNPQSSAALKAHKDSSVISNIGLNPSKKTVCIFMGSLGSDTIMKILLDYFKLTDGSYQIVYATGKRCFDYVNNNGIKKDYIKYVEVVDGVSFMENSDLLISRAGATTLAEIVSLGTPSILIPSPYVPNNHQYYNAKSLVDNDAALMIEEKDLSASKLNEMVKSIINDVDKLNALKVNARKLSNDDALKDIVLEIEKLWLENS